MEWSQEAADEARREHPEGCLKAWADLLDLGFTMAIDNLVALGRTREDAERQLAAWIERDAQERLIMMRRLCSRRGADGQ